jgi:enoyl-CoA hydratase
MCADVLIVERAAGIATVTLNRPDSMNALSRALRDAISAAFRDLQADGETRAVVLTGAGRAFCAGFDLRELADATGESAAETAKNDMPEAIEGFEGPIIGAINGHAITGGFELALACDVLVASDQAKFADTHARVGMLPGWGLSQKLPRMIGVSRAKEVSFTGNFVTAEQALEWGLVNRVVPAKDLVATCQGLARDMASCHPRVLREYKRLIDEGLGMPLADALRLEREAALRSAEQATAEFVGSRKNEVQSRGREQES